MGPIPEKQSNGDIERHIEITLGIVKDIKSVMLLDSGDNEELILNKLRTARQFAYSIDHDYLPILTARMHSENLLLVLTDLIDASGNYDDEIVDTAINLLSKLVEMHPHDVERVYSNSMVSSLKSQLANPNTRIVSSVQ